MDTHVRVLGVLNIAMGVIGLIVAALMLIGFGGAAGIISAAADADEAALAIPILGHDPRHLRPLGALQQGNRASLRCRPLNVSDERRSAIIPLSLTEWPPLPR